MPTARWPLILNLIARLGDLAIVAEKGSARSYVFSLPDIKERCGPNAAWSACGPNFRNWTEQSIDLMPSQPRASKVCRSGMRIDALTGLRFFAALHVVLFHFAVPLYDQAPLPIRALMQAGDASVTLFFMLSGFVLAYTYLGPTRLPIRLGRFWLARFARIYPAFLLAELLMLPYMLARQGVCERRRKNGPDVGIKAGQ